MKYRLKIVLISLIYASAVYNVKATASEVNKISQKDISTNFMKLNEKIDFLSDRMDKMEENSATEKEDEKKCYFVPIMSAIKEVFQKLDKFEERLQKLDKFEERLQKIEKFEKRLETIEKFEKRLERIEKFENYFSKINKIEELDKKTDENFKELTKRIEQKLNASDTKNDIISELTSLCESNLNVWVNETSDQFKEKLGQLEFCLKEDNKKASNACDPNPCLNGGRCELTSSKRDYLCAHCPHPTSGKNCENLNCDKANKCFFQNDTLYSVFETKVSWEQAKQKCADEGMALAMPKTKGSNEFLINQLKSSYGSTESVHFWIGLKYNANGQQWQWVDGSALGDYTAKRPDLKMHKLQQCVVLVLHDERMWYVFYYGNQYYLVCEKRVSIR